jgi:hypothetical protein
MFLLFAVLIGAGILGNGLFAEGDGGPPAASSGTEAEGDTQTPSPEDPSTASTPSRTTTGRQTEGEQPTSTTVADRTSTARQGTATTAADSFGTLTNRSSTATPSQEGSDSATPRDSESEATTGAGDASDDTAGGSGNYTDDDFSAVLRKEGIPVETLFPTEDPASGDGAMMTVLEYTTQASEGGSRDEASVVAQQYASAVAKGYESQALSVTVYTANDDPVATYRIERTWAIAYANGDISGEEYGRRISDTYRSY